MDSVIAMLIGGNTASRSVTVSASPMLTRIGGNTFTWSLMTIRSSTITTTVLGVTPIVGSVDVTRLPPIVAPIVVGVPAATPVNVAV